MTQEIIEKAAKELCTTESMPQWEKDYGMFCFMDGARWRIDSVWHDTNEKPKTYRQIIVEKIIIDDKKNYEIWKQEKHDNWEHDVDYFGVVRWAYVADLMPDGKEE